MYSSETVCFQTTTIPRASVPIAEITGIFAHYGKNQTTTNRGILSIAATTVG